MVVVAVVVAVVVGVVGVVVVVVGAAVDPVVLGATVSGVRPVSTPWPAEHPTTSADVAANTIRRMRSG
ncbi:hypothetical protein ACTJJE_10810 [Mycolicibacterium sp. 22603]|uniref:hypothetical protein n=1 Tax=Mycolicibacterium sp. 22603 TaxID=3453950 RepID=UPI003F85EF72